MAAALALISDVLSPAFLFLDVRVPGVIDVTTLGV